MDVLTIKPFGGYVRAGVKPEGSKSITNRALILAAALAKPCAIEGALFSRDTEIMIACLKALGVEVEADAKAKTISARGGIKNLRAELFVGNAGTAARFVTALAATVRGGEYKFDSDAAMYARPMKGLFDALRSQGAEFEFFGQSDRFPFIMRTNGFKGGKVEVDASESSQILSAMMMAARASDREIEIESGATVSAPFVKMTREMLAQFPAARYAVEPDATAASYFAMLPAITGGSCVIKNLAACRLQGDAAFAEVLERAGLIKILRDGADLIAIGLENFSNEPLSLDFNDISDTFLTLAAAAAFLPRKIKIAGIAHTRRQETDRVAAMASQLVKVCKSVSEGEDFLEIESYPAAEKCKTRGEICACLARNIKKPARIETFDDHRIAMSFAILGCADAGGAWIEIENPRCVSKTWREFFEVLDGARARSEKFKIVSVDGGAAVGKSSVSRAAAEILGYMHVDTGSHYRNLAYILLENGVSPDDCAGVGRALENLRVSSALEGNSAKILCAGRALKDSEIRSERINAVVSVFAAMPAVREFLKNYQRSMEGFARESGFAGLIMEGRDIGSVIFPAADARIFLDADEQTRAARRAGEGIADSVAKRDALDKNRKVAPLVCPEGASLIDTSRMAKEEVVARAVSIIINS